MYPEDRVLVAYVPDPTDFEIVRRERWYRIPKQNAPKGVHSEYFAFYFGSHFEAKKWAVHYYARQQGHELVKRRSLFPDQPEHRHADDLYYKIQLGPLQKLDRPIISLRWRRLTFLHTTWDRFQDATEINDLLVDGGEYIDRLFAALKERGLRVERNYRVQEPEASYELPMVVTKGGRRIEIDLSDLPESDDELALLVEEIVTGD
jgi:hypothetical protein